MSYKVIPRRERLLSHTDQDGPLPKWAPFLGPCWLYLGGKTTKGYGVFFLEKRPGKPRQGLAHRVAYELFVGPIPEGLQIDHLCRVRHCVNPAHLEPVTCQQNLLRSPITPTSINKAKTHCGRDHPFTPENTIRKPDGRRDCRTCHNTLQRERNRGKNGPERG